MGTRNEIFQLYRNRNVSIVGVDYSSTALQMAYNKALIWGKESDTFIMDDRHLEFAVGRFDKVLCIYVIDFVEEK